jgi:hypothetical protein
MVLADWIEEATGIDPARGWRGTYASALGAARVMKQAGGMVGHIDRILTPYGFKRTEQPVMGDIAVVEAPEGLMGVIVVSHATTVAIRGPGLAYRVGLPIAAAWRIDPCREP